MELFVTDLDGTLLNSNKEVSIKSTEILNKLIDNGVNFTVATARTPATVVDLLQDVNLKLPAVLMNGVLLYDIKEEKYINIKEIGKDTVDKVFDVLNKFDKNAMVYGIRNNHLWVYHKEFEYSWEYNFYKERADRKQKTFLKVENYQECINESKIINFIVFDKYEKIKGIYEELKKIDEISVEYYEDIYEKGCYFLEAYSAEASKANGIKLLSDYIEHDKLICFGDNLNDIPMFELADECYATANAVERVKEISTDVIGSCDEDGVALFMEKKLKVKS
ncbi:MAG: HAD family hydrolase [Clostridium sp.]|jgi:5-amino-6-(5-phospho-D-ribitylamino)uracil phosphatase|uniref:HAD family hydrolase n=2 Tax=Clostridium sp. TaxID=1506 RepID=UPI00267214C6|nr:HAD family hydrolase [Clostridium sp.]MCI7031601.1 HAD family hydrolase [Clostridium sp.]MDD7682895.1 HAD family hydrolase [Clostridium sp.]MDY2580053.1 HAD family hydrolase [Clostridium sp.]